MERHLRQHTLLGSDPPAILASLGATALVLLVGACATNRPPAVPTPSPNLGTFTLQCDPFEGLAEHQPIDDHCGPDGVGSPNSIAQNQVKNNFCAQGPVTVVNSATLQVLQSDVSALGLAFGSPQTIPTPTDRPKLQRPDTTHDITVGEGSLVQFVGFIIEAHYSDVQSGEAVNCDIPGQPTNDIHIAIGQAVDAPECTSITAEIIPHFRPHVWTTLARLNGADLVTLRQNARLDRPLRFTGQLMFDASHAPCAGQPTSSAPARVSSWGVHPVYRIDVCRETSLDQCAAVDDPVWTPLDRWNAEILRGRPPRHAAARGRRRHERHASVAGIRAYTRSCRRFREFNCEERH
jgi:hypothetical protein